MNVMQNRILHQSPQNLSMFMQSFAKVGLYRREIVELLMGHAKDMKSGFTFSQVLTLLDACVVIGHYDKDAYEWLLSAITQHSEDELSQGVLNKLNRIMYCIRLERPEFVEVATPATRTLIDMYQGNFQMDPPPEVCFRLNSFNNKQYAATRTTVRMPPGAWSRLRTFLSDRSIQSGCTVIKVRSTVITDTYLQRTSVGYAF